MEITFDPRKNALNIAKHGLSLQEAEEFEWHDALLWEDKRKDYGEMRMSGLGLIGNRVHSITFTYRAGFIRVISLRKANARERKCYEQEI